jgi:hypothetical protein
MKFTEVRGDVSISSELEMQMKIREYGVEGLDGTNTAVSSDADEDAQIGVIARQRWNQLRTSWRTRRARERTS